MFKRIWQVFLILTLVCSAFAQQPSIITEIDIRGNTAVTKDAILSRMRTKVGQPYVQAQLDQDKLAVENMGFFKAVDVRAIPLEGDNWKILVEVSEYPVVKEIRIVGNTVMKTEELLKVITVQVGQPFNLTEQRPSAEAIFKAYSAKGYFGLVEQLEPLEDSPGTVSIVVREMMVNSVGVQGNTRTKSRVFDRLIKTRPGEVYNIKKWDDDLRRIFSTQWFEKVVPVETDAPQGFAKDLVVDVKEARTGDAVVGLSVDPRSNFAGSIRLSDRNFRGTGQTVGISYLQTISGGGASIDLDYTNPFIDNRDTSLSVSLYSRLLYRFSGSGFGGSSSPTDERFTERRTGGAFSLTRPLSANTSGTVGLRFEGIKTSDLGTTNANSFIQQDGDVGVLTIGWNRNTRDVDFDPARGDYVLASIEPGYSNIKRVGGAFPDTSLLGNSTFLRGTVEYRTYWSDQAPRTSRELDQPRRVLAFRARGGTVTGKVPFFEQYFVGGAESLRGYQDDRFWGKTFLATTLEYRYPIQKSFNAVAFIDAAGAWGGYGAVNDFSQSSKFKMNVGYGLGFSFRTPLGPIRLDFGFNSRGGSRTHFLIGTSF
ncbi:MAG TPA: BamA/TamA family outer membrane protein [Fimbriimonadaceae bacterium]|nr:BamA/TamA family outer membrane protein [Fimbriimonadaceae bacterium]